MAMTTRYEAYNEMIFEAYCKTAISRSVLKERLRKAEQGKREQPFPIVTDAMLYDPSCENTGIEQTETACRTFYVCGVAVPVHGEKLGQAFSYLMLRDREIALFRAIEHFQFREPPDDFMLLNDRAEKYISL